MSRLPISLHLYSSITTLTFLCFLSPKYCTKPAFVISKAYMMADFHHSKILSDR